MKLRKDEKAYKPMTDKVFVKLMIFSVLWMLLLIACLVSLTWAWFSDDICNSSGMTNANYYVDITIQDANGENILSKSAYATLNAQPGRYTVSLSAHGSSESTGYLLVDLGHPLNIDSEAPDVPRMNKTNVISPGETYSFTLYLENYTDLSFSQVWGNDTRAASQFDNFAEVGIISDGQYIEEVLPPPPPPVEDEVDTSKVDTSEVDTSETDTSETDTSEADTSEADTSEADTSEVDTSEADTSEADTSEADTSEVDTSEADTSEADTSEADTSEADTSEADTSEVDTSEADTSEADTSEADTSGADTSEADTSGADTSEADTSETDTSEADTSGADTSEVDTSEVDTSEADISEVDTSEAETEPISVETETTAAEPAVIEASTKELVNEPDSEV
jgi:uncharacterized protein YjbI with pentapeptide repeats